jgi:hypothetical protein
MSAQVVVRLDVLGEMVMGKEFADEVEKRLKANPITGWTEPVEAMPAEDRPVFFMTLSGHWAGYRNGDDWCDWGDKGLICVGDDVLMWQYAPEVKR